jgi:hypothetical protein
LCFSKLHYHNVKMRQCANSNDICFISNSKTQENYNRLNHHLKYFEVLGLCCVFPKNDLHFLELIFLLQFVPDSEIF